MLSRVHFSLHTVCPFQGDEADCMYFVESGVASIRIRKQVCNSKLQCYKSSFLHCFSWLEFLYFSMVLLFHIFSSCSKLSLTRVPKL